MGGKKAGRPSELLKYELFPLRARRKNDSSISTEYAMMLCPNTGAPNDILRISKLASSDETT